MYDITLLVLFAWGLSVWKCVDRGEGVEAGVLAGG